MDDDAAVQRARTLVRLVTLGLAGSGLAFVLTALSLEDLTRPLRSALYCFAFSIPVNIAVALTWHRVEHLGPKRLGATGLVVLYYLGAVVAVVGFTLILLSLGRWLALLFVGAGVLAILSAAWFARPRS